MANNYKKHAELLILELLINESDENHPLSRAAILNYMKEVYDVQMDRRTLYVCLDALRNQGAEISTFEDNHKGYYLKKRQFTPEEVMLLCMAVHNCKLLPLRQSQRMIERLVATQNRYFKESYDDGIFETNPLRGEGKTAAIALEVITQAIREKKNVRFYYRGYRFHERLGLRMGRKIIDVDPLYIMFRYGSPYLAAQDYRTKEPCCYPLERMADITMGDRTFQLHTNHLYPQPCYMNHTAMITPDGAIDVRARVDISILEELVQCFGRDMDLESEDENHAILHFWTMREDAVKAAERFVENMEILEPEDLRRDVHDRIASSLGKYE